MSESTETKVVQAHAWSVRWTPEWVAYTHPGRTDVEVMTNDNLPRLHDWLKDIKANRYIITLERGAETKRLHFQCAVSFGTKNKAGERRTVGALRESFLTFMKADKANVNFQPAHSNTAIRNYVLKKDETFVAGPWYDPTKTEEEALGIGREYTGADLPKVWRPWQQKIIDLVKTKAEPEDPIYWVHNPEGGAGKSKLCKYLQWKFKAMVIRWMSAKDISALVVAAGQLNIYLFDLSRNKGKDFTSKDIYEAMETLKDGGITSGKYEGGKLFMDPPHVIVFANFAPFQWDFSEGRVNIIESDEFVNYKRSTNLLPQFKRRFGDDGVLKMGKFATKEKEERPAKRQKVKDSRNIDEAVAAAEKEDQGPEFGSTKDVEEHEVVLGMTYRPK